MFSKEQRNGIFLLILLIIGLQCLYFFMDSSSSDVTVNTDELHIYQKEIDSLKQIAIEKTSPKIYPFNPNYITDYKGYTLGMSNEEINRLLTFRNQGEWINSVKQFQARFKYRNCKTITKNKWHRGILLRANNKT